MGSAAVLASHRKKVKKEEAAEDPEDLEEEVTVKIELLPVVVS